MADSGGRELFRKKSLERLSSPERLDQLLRVVDQKTWLPLGAMAVLVLSVLVWSIVATIPLNVEGKGILLRPKHVVEVQARGTGRLLEIEVQPGGSVEEGTVLARIAKPELIKQIQLQQAKAAQLTDQSRRAGDLRDQRTVLEESSTRTQSDLLRKHIHELERVAEELREQRLQSIAKERERLQEQLERARELSASVQERMEKLLEQENLFSDKQQDELKESHIESVERLIRIEGDLSELASDELQAEEDYLNRLKHIGDLRYEREGLGVREKELAQENLEEEGSYEQQIADVNREIERLELRLDEETRIVSEHAGIVLEVSVVPGQILEPGDRIGSFQVIDPDEPLISLTYFTVRDGKRLEEDSMIRVTPDTVERQRFGSIKGRIRKVGPYPVSLSEVRTMVGNRAVAEVLTSAGHLIEVEATLDEMEGAPGVYAWTSSKGRDVALSAGITTTARVAVEEVRPIALVLPFLKTTIGMD